MIYIAVDLDEVLWDVMGEFTRLYNFVYKKKRTIEEWDEWDCCEEWGITNTQKNELFSAINLMDVPIIDKHASKYVKKLQYYGTVDLLSARKEEDRRKVIEKLESMDIFEGNQYRKLILVALYPYNIKTNYHYDVYIDDSPMLAKSITEENKKRNKNMKQLLWDQPWNWKFEPNEHIKRVTGWKQIFQWFENYPNL